MSQRLFLEDPRARTPEATIERTDPERLALDRTVFYARESGQLSDTGSLRWHGGTNVIGEAVNRDGRDILHPVLRGPAPAHDLALQMETGWPRHHDMMRTHTAMHLLSSRRLGAHVTGEKIGSGRLRLEFDLPQPPRRERLAEGLAALIAADQPDQRGMVGEAMIDTDPELVGTFSVQLPGGTGRLRLVRSGSPERPVGLHSPAWACMWPAPRASEPSAS